MLPESNRELEDVAIELTSAANRFASRLHPLMRASVGDLVRSMNLALPSWPQRSRGSQARPSFTTIFPRRLIAIC